MLIDIRQPDSALTIKLHMDETLHVPYWVTIDDARTDDHYVLTAETRKDAVDRYMHPFAFISNLDYVSAWEAAC